MHEFTNNEREISIPHEALSSAVFKISSQTLIEPKPWCNDHGVNLHHDNDVRRLFCHNPVSRGTNQPIRKSEFLQCVKVE